jgi:hypothetical protein
MMVEYKDGRQTCAAGWPVKAYLTWEQKQDPDEDMLVNLVGSLDNSFRAKFQ